MDGRGREKVARAVLVALLAAALLAGGRMGTGEMQDEQRLVTYYEEQGFDMSYRSW